MGESKTLTTLITGATGNVGSELTKQLSAQKIPLLETHLIHDLTARAELQSAHPGLTRFG